MHNHQENYYFEGELVSHCVSQVTNNNKDDGIDGDGEEIRIGVSSIFIFSFFYSPALTSTFFLVLLGWKSILSAEKQQ